MIDPEKTEYHRLRSIAHLPDAGPVWDWDDNVSPTIAIREIFRRAEAGDEQAAADRAWINEQIKQNSTWHLERKIMQPYRDWLSGKPFVPQTAHLWCPHCHAIWERGGRSIKLCEEAAG